MTFGSATCGVVRVTLLAGDDTKGHPAGTKTGDVIHVFQSGSIQMITDVSIDPAGNVWAANNWNSPRSGRRSRIRPVPPRPGAVVGLHRHLRGRGPGEAAAHGQGARELILHMASGRAASQSGLTRAPSSKAAGLRSSRGRQPKCPGRVHHNPIRQSGLCTPAMSALGVSVIRGLRMAMRRWLSEFGLFPFPRQQLIDPDWPGDRRCGRRRRRARLRDRRR